MQYWAFWTPPCGPAGRRPRECFTYLHRSSRRDKGTSRRFPSRWHTLHTRAGSQTCPSSCPCQVSPLSSALQGLRQDPAPRTGPLVWPLSASLSPLCSAQSFPWWGAHGPARLGSRSVLSLLLGSWLDWFVLFEFSRLSLEGITLVRISWCCTKPFWISCNHKRMNKSDDKSVMTYGKSLSGCSLMARKSISSCSLAANIDWPRNVPDPSQPSEDRKPREIIFIWLSIKSWHVDMGLSFFCISYSGNHTNFAFFFFYLPICDINKFYLSIR